MHTYVSLMLLSLLPILLSVKAGIAEVHTSNSLGHRADVSSCTYPCSDRGSGRRDFNARDAEAGKARGSGRRESEVDARKRANFG